MPDFVPPNVTAEEWAKSDVYLNKFTIRNDPALDAAQQNSRANGLPEIAVSVAQGKFLKLAAQSIGAKRILEVGTLGGYSTVWLARALPDDGKLITLELLDKHAQIARENIDRAGLLPKVEIKVGPAADTIKALNANEPFDFIFVDADDIGVLTYFKEAKRLARKEGVIIVDNVNHWGRVSLQPENTDDVRVKSVRSLLEYIKGENEVDATILSMTSAKGYDGMLYAVKL